MRVAVLQENLIMDTDVWISQTFYVAQNAGYLRILIFLFNHLKTVKTVLSFRARTDGGLALAEAL